MEKSNISLKLSWWQKFLVQLNKGFSFFNKKNVKMTPIFQALWNSCKKYYNSLSNKLDENILISNVKKGTLKVENLQNIRLSFNNEKKLINQNINNIIKIPNASITALEYAIKKSPQIINNLDVTQQLKLVKSNSSYLSSIKKPSFKLLSPLIKKHPEFYKIAHQSDKLSLQLLEVNSDVFKFVQNKSEELSIKAVSLDGLLLNEMVSTTEKINFAAVNQNPNAIKLIFNPSIEVACATIELDSSLTNEVLSKNGNALKVIPLKDRTPERCKIAYNQTNDAFEHIPDTVQLSMLDKALETNPHCIQFIAFPTLNEYRKAISIDPTILKYLYSVDVLKTKEFFSLSFKTTNKEKIQVIDMALDMDVRNLQYVQKELFVTPEFLAHLYQNHIALCTDPLKKSAIINILKENLNTTPAIKEQIIENLTPDKGKTIHFYEALKNQPTPIDISQIDNLNQRSPIVQSIMAAQPLSNPKEQQAKINKQL